MSFEELQRHIAKMMKQMNQAAAELNFEKAAKLRDRWLKYKKHLEEIRVNFRSKKQMEVSMDTKQRNTDTRCQRA